MNRRRFIKQTVKGVGALALSTALPLDLLAKSKYKKITILHTNDMHSWIEPYTKGQYQGMGGMAQRATLIKSIRKKEDNVLLLDAGDIFQGTPYFNHFGGEVEFKLMSKMNYDVATIGNHDFDNGLEGLKKMLPHADFPFVNCNYDFSQTQLADDLDKFVIFEREGIKIGVFGLGVELDGLVDKSKYGDTEYLDPIERAREVAKELRYEKGCHIVICLSHLGYKYDSKKVCDIELAKNVDGIDLIIGGHTHTFMSEPHIEKSPNGEVVIINQVGWAGINLGRIDFYVDYQQSGKYWQASTVPVVDKLLIRG